MTGEQAFKVGFLLKCAEDGCSKEQIHRRIERAAGMTKAADSASGGLATSATDKALNWAGSFIPDGSSMRKLIAEWGLPKALTALAVGPPAIGGLTGYAIANARGSSYTPEDASRDEELSNYYEEINRMRQIERQQKERQKLLS
jgi:hypothetical protein